MTPEDPASDPSTFSTPEDPTTAVQTARATALINIQQRIANALQIGSPTSLQTFYYNAAVKGYLFAAGVTFVSQATWPEQTSAATSGYIPKPSENPPSFEYSVLPPGHYSFSPSLSYSNFDYDGYDGNGGTLNLPFSAGLTENVGITASIPIAYSEMKVNDGTLNASGIWEEETISQLATGLTIAMPIDFNPKAEIVRWQIAPSVGVSSSWLEMDSALRSRLNLKDNDDSIWAIHSALASSVGIKVHKNFILDVGNAVTTAFPLGDARKIKNSNNQKILPDQYLLTNGIRATVPFGNGLSIFASFLDNRNLSQDANIDNFQSYGGGFGFKLSPYSSISLGYFYDTGTNYFSHTGECVANFIW